MFSYSANLFDTEHVVVRCQVNNVHHSGKKCSQHIAFLPTMSLTNMKCQGGRKFLDLLLSIPKVGGGG